MSYITVILVLNLPVIQVLQQSFMVQNNVFFRNNGRFGNQTSLLNILMSPARKSLLRNNFVLSTLIYYFWINNPHRISKIICSQICASCQNTTFWIFDVFPPKHHNCFYLLSWPFLTFQRLSTNKKLEQKNKINPNI